MKFLVIAMVIYLAAAGPLSLFAVIYPMTALVLIIQCWTSRSEWKNKLLMSILYLSVMVIQLTFIALVVFTGNQAAVLLALKRLVAVFMIMIPFAAVYVNYLYKVNRSFFPAARDASAVSIQMMKEVYVQAGSMKKGVLETKKTLSRDNLSEIAKELPRHSYIRYLNQNSLTDVFFQDCEASMEDGHIYLVVSCTGSPSSELISVFTRKEYNHVSLSFDRDLKTILSYNGGENVYPPGLNQEQLQYFQRKEDASMMVYALEAPREKKQLILDKIREINETGSAYNLVGLVTKVSVRPNIMFCSQFVYSILRCAGLAYFTERAACVKPSDFIEQDYYRKLKFCYEIRFRDSDCAAGASAS